jgi:hypothetical protein
VAAARRGAEISVGAQWSAAMASALKCVDAKKPLVSAPAAIHSMDTDANATQLNATDATTPHGEACAKAFSWLGKA